MGERNRGVEVARRTAMWRVGRILPGWGLPAGSDGGSRHPAGAGDEELACGKQDDGVGSRGPHATWGFGEEGEP